MCLQAVAQVVEAGVVRHSSRIQPAGQIVYFVRQRVPDAMVFLGRSSCGRFARVALFDEWVQVDHFNVSVEGFEDGLACDSGWQARYRGENGSFRHRCWRGGRILCVEVVWEDGLDSMEGFQKRMNGHDDGELVKLRSSSVPFPAHAKKA